MLNRLKDLHRNEEGQALVLVLVISFMLVLALAIAVPSNIASLTFSSQYSSTSQSMLASRAGLDATLATLRNTGSYTSFTCANSGTLSFPGAQSSYSVAVQYFAAGGGSIPCTGSGSTLGGSTPPTAATLIATGTAPHGTKVKTEETLSIATVPAASAALGYAIFTSSNLTISNASNLNKVGSGPTPDIYAGQTVSCTNGTISQGNVVTYQPIALSGGCTFSGSLTATGSVSLANSSDVGGALISYGSGGISMSGSAKIGGNATSTGGNISLPSGSPNIAGNAYAYGTITVGGGASITGTKTANDTGLASMTAPAQITFPAVNLTTASWPGSWNVVQIPNSTYTTCASFFANNSSGAADAFMTDLYSATVNTVIYAPTCAVTYSHTHLFYLNSDVALVVASLSLNNSNTFCAEASLDSQTCSSTTTRLHNFEVLASASPPSTCSTSSVTVTFSNSSSFSSNLSVFVYTLGEVSYANAPSMNGQILACGGFTGSNAFTLNFDPTASGDVPGLGGSGTNTITVLTKFVLSG